MIYPINTFEVGNIVDDVFLVADVKVLTSDKRAGWFGLKVTLQDATGTIPAFLSMPDEGQRKYAHTWKTARVRGFVTTDRFAGENAIQIKADALYFEEPETMDGLIPVALQGANEYLGRLNEHICALSSPLCDLLRAIFDDRTNGRFLTIPAARSLHHAVQGGLLQHSVEVADLAEAMARAWNARGRSIDVALCIAGALTHDLGKLAEFDGDTVPVEYGRSSLLGHVCIGAMIVNRAIDGLPGVFPDDLREELLHIVLSHHGKGEYGAPVEPRTPEARIVADADAQSAWIQAWHETAEKGGKLFEKSPICGYVLTGPRHNTDAPSATVSRGMQFVNLPPKSPPAEDQPSLFGEVARRRAGCEPVPMRPQPDPADDLDDPFAGS